MKLIEDSDSPLKGRFNLQEAKVIYVSRAFGKKHLPSGEILPFKEFDVKRDDVALIPYLEKAREIKIFKESGLIPNGICGTAMDTHAKSCSVCGECFGGKYPAGAEVSLE
jgi:hypothetical protein